MEHRIVMTICGDEYKLIAEESPEYMEKVGNLVDQKMSEILGSSHNGRVDAAVLTAINLADDYLKAQEANENLRKQLKSYIDEAAQTKNEVSELKRQIFKYQQALNKR